MLGQAKDTECIKELAISNGKTPVKMRIICHNTDTIERLKKNSNTF